MVDITGGPGGGSGEVAVRWSAAAGAVGYRVLRGDAPGGPFEVSAEFDITTGTVSAGDEVTNIWSQYRSYLPEGPATGGPDPSPWFAYVDVASGASTPRYFRVVAYNAAGDAPPSGIVCAAPLGASSC